MSRPRRALHAAMHAIARRLAGLLFLLALAIPGCIGPLRAQSPAPEPFQRPLLTLAQVPVKPNLMITLDDSASMGLLYLPETAVKVGGWSFQSPAFGRGIAFDPRDQVTDNLRTSEGLLPSRRGTPDWQQRAMRSPETNALYYNPDLRYRPWLRADGTRYPSADIRAAVLDLGQANSPTIDLTATQWAVAGKWCEGDMVDCSQTTVMDFVPGLYYRLQRLGGDYRNPALAASYLEFDVNAAAGLPRAPGRSDCAAVVCTQQEEQQNFANWFVYYRSRLHMAKALLGETLTTMGNQLRVGWGMLGQQTGNLDGLTARVEGLVQPLRLGILVSGVRDWDLVRKAQFLQWLYGVHYYGATPLGLAIQEVGRYYESADSQGPWGETPGQTSTRPQASCRRAFHLMITDGYWTTGGGRGQVARGDVDSADGPVIPLADGSSWQYKAAPPYKGPGKDFPSDMALYYWYRDLRPDLANKVPVRPDNEASWQAMSNFIVGLGVDGLLDPERDLPGLSTGTRSWGGNGIDDLWHAALNSRGAYFKATTPESLRAALRNSLSSMVNQDQGQAGVVTAAVEAGEGNRRYLAVYHSTDWSGDLRALPIEGSSGATAPLWTAERALPAWADRRLFIWDEDAATPGAVPLAWSALSDPLQAAIGKAEGAALIDYLRGDRSREGDGPWRSRGGLLGDFINSTPVVAGDAADPALGSAPDADKSYAAYLAGIKKSRARVVYAGANDGMLHAFRDTAGADGTPAGRELFAYIPRAVAGDLVRLRDPDYAQVADRHRYLVDGPLRLADVQAPPPGGRSPAWRNYLLGSTGAGPAAVFALDVTDPATLGAASVRWEIRGARDEALGHVMAPIATGQLPNGQWVALFGNGYGSRSGQAFLFVVEVATGLAHTVALPATAQANGLGGVTLRRNAAGQVTGLYAGDLMGRLWRLDFNASAKGWFSLGLGGQPLFQAEAGQALLQAPWLQMRGEGGLLAFGTGRLITAADADDAAAQAVYVVEDRPGDPLARPLGPAQLVARSLSALPRAGGQASTDFYAVSNPSIDWANQRGWRLPLTGPGVPERLRVLQALQPLGRSSDMFLVAAEAPARAPADGGDPCDLVQGQGVNLLLKATGGSALTQPVLDTNGDGRVNGADSALAAGYRTLADGVDAILISNTPAASQPAAGGAGNGAGNGSGNGPGTSGGSSDASACTRGLRLLGSSGVMAACQGGSLLLRARVWRRILQPPF